MKVYIEVLRGWEGMCSICFVRYLLGLQSY